MEELKKKLKDIEEREFYLKMQDHWDSEDFKLSDELHQESMKLKKQIEEMEEAER